jgi:hypothetical protein
MNRARTESAEADQAWAWLLRYMDEWRGKPPVLRGQDPRTGELLFERPPKIPERIAHAARMAGGIESIAQTEYANLHFRKDTFTSAFQDWQYAQDLLALPPVSGGERKQLCGETRVAQPRREDLRGGLKSIFEDACKAVYKPAPPLNDTELEEKKRQAFEVAKRFV